jgi:thiamine-monophosphate kinase
MGDVTPPELAYLAKLRQQLPNGESLRDDCHHTPATGQVVSVDCFVEHRHFEFGWMQPEQVGFKCASAALSDIAAMGATATGLLVGLTVPPLGVGDDETIVLPLYQGLQAALAQASPTAELLGGDWVAGPCWQLAITVLGQVAHRHSVGLRTHAQAGDVVLLWQGHDHGLAGLGCTLLQQGLASCANPKQWSDALTAHTHPSIGYVAGIGLASLGQRYALMDTSDGLADAALKLSQLSRVSVVLDETALPLHPLLLEAEALGLLKARHTQLYGGEDFGLLATCAYKTWRQLPAGLGWQVVGRVEAVPDTLTKGEGCAWLRTSGETLQSLRYGLTYHHHT